MSPAWLGFAKPGIFVTDMLQVVVPDSLESVVAMEIVAADVVRRVGSAYSPEGHGAQLGLIGIIHIDVLEHF